MGLFSKNVCDPDMCFARDIIEVGGAIIRATNVAIAKEWMMMLTKKYHIEEAMYEYTNKSINAKNCYPIDQQIKFSRAQELLKVAKTLELSGFAYCDVIGVASACVKKWDFHIKKKLN
jgi:hypothetical protein